MPYTPRNPDDGEPPAGPGVSEDGDGYTAVNEAPIYSGDWQVPDPEQYTAGQRAPLTTIATGGGRAMVRTNVPMTFSVSSIFIGSLNGTIPAGATLSGADANHNGIPDQLENAYRHGWITIQH